MRLAPYYQSKFIESVTFVAGGSVFLQNGIPRDFPLRGLLLDVRFRMHVVDPGAGAAGALLPEAPFTLLQRLIVTGVHRDRGTETILNMEGSTLRRYNHFYTGQVPYYYNPDTLAGAAGDYDCAFEIYIPFALERVTPEQELLTLLDAQAYTQLSLQIDCGNDDDVYNATHTMTDTIQGIGGAGNPIVRVSRVVGLLGKDVTFRPALVKRTFRDVDANVTGTDIFLADLQVGNTVRSYFLKLFNRAAAAQAPNAAAFYTEETMPLGRTRLKLNEVPIRDMDLNDQYHYNLLQYGLRQADTQIGYACFDFVENGDMDQGLVTFDFAARSKRFQLTGDITGNASDRLHIVCTEIIPARG